MNSLKKKLSKNEKFLELILYGNNQENILKYPTIQTGFITKPLKLQLEKLKNTAALYS